MNLKFRCMTSADIPLGMRLKNAAGWNQTEADWERFLDLSQGGAFVATRDGTAVGTVATFLFGSVGWVAMLLVDQDHRHQGIGTRLLEHAVAVLQGGDARTIRLDATPLGRPIYETFGFQAEYDLHRFEGTLRGTGAGELDTDLAVHLGAIFLLDREVTGTDRQALLQSLAGRRAAWGCAWADGGALEGYLLTRPGSRALQIGPAAARSDRAGGRLLDTAATRLAGTTAFIDIPEPNAAATQWAETQGLVRQRVLTRMFLGEPVGDQPERLWASSGPEKG